jgi:ubiquinone/menaquinone biosynthesis C-methylase UbiE
MNYTAATYSISYDPLDQQIEFQGVFRADGEGEVIRVFSYLAEVHDQVGGTLSLSFRRLRYINALGVKAVSLFIAYAKGYDRLKVKIIASSVIAWTEHVLPTLAGIWDGVEYIVYDSGFYKSQSIIENLDFIPLLRDQTRILWPQEREVLGRHGLRKDMRVADICCGCGDVSLLFCREFEPRHVVGIDHSDPAIQFARELQRKFEIPNAEFQRGDATTLMLNDDSFDFVACRLSLQIFSKPEQILKELIRITKPGGRIYTLCEDYDLILGYPEAETIHQAYGRAALYGDAMGMDLRSGKKLYNWLASARLEDIRSDQIVVDTTNTDREAFAHVVRSWRAFSVFTIGEILQLSRNEQGTLLAGYDAQLRSIQSTYGYSSWGLFACSGRKPLR